MKNKFNEFIKGLIKENPTFVLMLGLCPTLAISTTIKNGLGMGVATTFVLVGSNTIINLIRKIVPNKIRIPCFIVVIASFVTIVELVMKAYLPILDRALGIYIPLIVVNCIVLARAEAFASKETLLNSILDGLGMGCGFTFALLLISVTREVLGMGTFFDNKIKGFEPIFLLSLPSGALIIIGLLLGFFNFLKEKRR
ncbi:MAG: electron transport complex subunit E [Candidatus Omnitrophica bacterium]|nr:electron transport complex subunit E [Candidatus Omnitrophota bacterium]